MVLIFGKLKEMVKKIGIDQIRKEYRTKFKS